jgi:L-lactate dehydrogenase complex protein LldG
MTDKAANLLSRIATILGRPMPAAAPHDHLFDELGSLRPKLAGRTSRDAFIAKATSERLTATVERLASLADVPAAVYRYRAEKRIGPAPVIGPDPRLTSLHWAPIEPSRTIRPDSALAVTVADYGIAETGSLVFTSTPATPTLLNFLPLHHVAVLHAERILDYLEDYWRVAGMPSSRSVNFVTGTSGTADIEGRNVRGAHGPRYLHILLVDEAVTSG